MKRRGAAQVAGLVGGLLCSALQVAQAADRVPVAVLWGGEPETLAEGVRLSEELLSGVRNSSVVRELDSAQDRHALVEGGPSTRAAERHAEGDRLFVKLRCADAVREYEAAERLLLEEVPLPVTQARLGAVERNLLVCYDQLGRAADAARAAERLTWTAGSHDELRPLLDRHLVPRLYGPERPPVQVTTTPPGIEVSRNLAPVGPTPLSVPGGDSTVDGLDLWKPGFRRLHVPLGQGGAISLTVVPEDRLGVAVDALRAGGRADSDGAAEEVASLGRRVGAARLLVLSPDGSRVVARVLDVTKAAWTATAERVELAPASSQAGGGVGSTGGAGSSATTIPSGSAPAAGAAKVPPSTVAAATAPETPVSRLVRLLEASVQPIAVAAAPVAGQAVTAQAPAKGKSSKWGSWGKWYTWAAAGGVVLIVGGLLIAQSVGSDSLTIQVSK